MLPNDKSATKLVVLASVTLTCVSGIASSPTKISTYSPDIHLDHTIGVVRDEDSACQHGAGIGKASFGSLPDAADLDAVHGFANSDVLFSLESSIVLGGVLYRPCDVIRFDGNQYSKELDGRAEGIPDGVNVDAVAMSGETLLLSVDIDARLGAVTVTDSDVIAFDGNAFSVFLDASSTGIDRASDVDALHIDELGHVLVSFDGAGVLGSIDYRDEDMLAWASGDWSLEFDGRADDAAWIPVDLDAWSVVFINDNIFVDGFE